MLLGHRLTNRKRNLVVVEHELSQLTLELLRSHHPNPTPAPAWRHLVHLTQAARQLRKRRNNLAVVEHVLSQLILKRLLSQG